MGNSFQMVYFFLHQPRRNLKHYKYRRRWKWW